MRYVIEFGEVYRLTERNYRRFLRDGADGTRGNWDIYGAKMVAGNVENTTDWEEREFIAEMQVIGMKVPAHLLEDE